MFVNLWVEKKRKNLRVKQEIIKQQKKQLTCHNHHF